MGSIWSETVTLPSRSALEGEHSTEVAVVGGGMAGVLTAWFLRQRGAKVLLLEAERLAGGQTRNTTAKITAQHGMIYERLSEQKGELAARQYASANQRAVEAYRRLVRERKIPCEWEDCPAFLYSTQEEDPVRQEAHTAARLGLECSFTLETELPFPVKGAARLEGQARFHPLRFLGALAEELEVFEHSRVIAAEGGALRTERGRVKAEQVVFTTHYPFHQCAGLYFPRMHQSAAMCWRPRGGPV
ncbi:MAG: NAD(P)/FAD-dependent oxidoreductase [Intestinimonas sp.]